MIIGYYEIQGKIPNNPIERHYVGSNYHAAQDKAITLTLSYSNVTFYLVDYKGKTLSKWYNGKIYKPEDTI